MTSPRLSALMLAALSAVSAPALAQTFSTVAQPQGDADRLAAAMRTLGSNPQNVEALVTAAELSLRLNDAAGAASLFARADKVDPRNARVKAGMAALLVHEERPGEALRYFNMAEGYGLPPARFAAERGLAFDLIGEQERAQRDYRLALAGGPNDEVVRRYGLSLGISGKQDAALAQLDTLIRKGDRGAWRARAFVLAMNGDVAGANKIATTMMPPGMAQGLGPFFQRLPALSAADRAFAVHYGETRPTPERLADARMVPALPTLAPEPGAATMVAAARPVPTPVPDAKADRRSRRDRRDRTRVETAAVAPTPTPTPALAPSPPAYAAATVQPLPGVATNASPATPLGLAQRAPATPYPLQRYPAVGAAAQPNTGRASAPNAITRAAAPTQLAQTNVTNTLPRPPAGQTNPAIPTARVAAAPTLAATPTLAARPVTANPPAAGTAAAATGAAAPAVGIAPAATSPAARVGLAAVNTAAPTSANNAVPASADGTAGAAVPVAARAVSVPARAVAAVTRQAVPSLPAAAAAVPSNLTVPARSTSLAATSSRVTPSLHAPAATHAAGGARSGGESSLASIMAGISVPPSELAVAPAAAPLVPRGTRVAVARAAGTAATPLATPGTRATAAPGKAARSSIAADESVTPSRRKGTPAATDEAADEATPARSKGKQLAAADASKRTDGADDITDTKRRKGRKADDTEAADAKAAKLTPAQKRAAEKKAAADKAATDERRAGKAEPERIWVQVAGGANEGDLNKAWRAQQAKAAALKGRAAYATPLRATNRVVTGPFKTDAEARAFVNQLAKQGISAFPFTSEKGQKMTKLPSK